MHVGKCGCLCVASRWQDAHEERPSVWCLHQEQTGGCSDGDVVMLQLGNRKGTIFEELRQLRQQLEKYRVTQNSVSSYDIQGKVLQSA